MKSRSFLHLLALRASLAASIFSPGVTWAASIGNTEPVGFGPTVVNSFCEIQTGAGSLGVSRNRQLITSDSSEGGTYTGTRTAGTISATSNLSNTGSLFVDDAKLSGGPTSASTSEVKLTGGSSGAWGTSDSIKLNSDGSLPATSVNVKFIPTGSRFENGTYTAAATVTCTDNGTK